MTKYLEINDSGFVWHVPLLTVAEHRARYYAARDKDTTFEDERDYVMEDEDEGIDWFLNNMDWEDVESSAVFVRAPEALTKPRINSSNCGVEVIESDEPALTPVTDDRT